MRLSAGISHLKLHLFSGEVKNIARLRALSAKKLDDNGDYATAFEAHVAPTPTSKSVQFDDVVHSFQPLANHHTPLDVRG